MPVNEIYGDTVILGDLPGGITCCTVAITNPATAIGTANKSETQADDQFAKPTNVNTANEATTSHETHLRIARAATIGGIASTSPSDTSDIGAIEVQKVNANAASASAHHIALSTDTHAAYTRDTARPLSAI
jgi:hypothetical protein